LRLVAGHDRRDRTVRDRRGRPFVSAIANLKAARTLALDDDLALQRTQFDLANAMASGIDLFCDQVEARSVCATTLALFRR